MSRMKRGLCHQSKQFWEIHISCCHCHFLNSSESWYLSLSLSHTFWGRERESGWVKSHFNIWLQIPLHKWLPIIMHKTSKHCSKHITELITSDLLHTNQIILLLLHASGVWHFMWASMGLLMIILSELKSFDWVSHLAESI